MPGVGLGEISRFVYNGYEFGNAYHLTSSEKYVEDSAGRVIVSVDITFSVDTVIQADDVVSLDTEIDAIRTLLTKKGGLLIVQHDGLGKFGINTGGIVKDIAYGPTPGPLKLTPLGAGLAVRVEWSVTARLAPCPSSDLSTRFKGVMEMNYGISYDISEAGLTTRTISGHIIIAGSHLTGRASKNISDAADKHRKSFTALTLNGFKRTQNWSSDESKRRLDFTITDIEIDSPTPYPEGVEKINMPQTVRNGKGRGRIRDSTINGSIRVLPNYKPQHAWHVFNDIAQQKLDAAEKIATRLTIHTITGTVDPFSRDSTFSLSFTQTTSLQALFNNIGLWTAIAGTDWARWTSSTKPTMLDKRGCAQLKNNEVDDVLVTLCEQFTEIEVGKKPKRCKLVRAKGADPVNTQPPLETSYHIFEMNYAHFRVDPITRQPLLQQPTEEKRFIPLPDGTIKALEAGVSDPSEPMKAPGPETSQALGTNDGIHIAGNPRYGISVTGFARRVGYPVPKPRIDTVGGQAAVEVASIFIPTQSDTWFGVKVFEAAWKIDYILPNAPTTITTATNLRDDG